MLDVRSRSPHQIELFVCAKSDLRGHERQRGEEARMTSVLVLALLNFQSNKKRKVSIQATTRKEEN